MSDKNEHGSHRNGDETPKEEEPPQTIPVPTPEHAHTSEPPPEQDAEEERQEEQEEPGTIDVPTPDVAKH